MRKASLILLLILSTISGSFAQNRDRVYLHTDKSGYIAGETVWFKAYLMSGLVPGSLGTNLFVDVVNESGFTIVAARYPIFGGVALGNLDLPLGGLVQGVYYLRAYTNTKPAVDRTSLYIKPIYIFNTSLPGNSTVPGDYAVVFRPSSGWLVAGLDNKLYINATDRSGHPSIAQGEILNAKNESIATFKTDEKGRAMVSINPLAGEKYIAKLNYADGGKKTADLPSIETSKVIINISDAPKAKLYQVLVPPTLANNAAMTIRGYMDDNIIFEKTFAAAANKPNAKIPIDELPTGLMQLKVTDAQNQELGSAVTWIATESPVIPLQLRADTLSFAAKGQNVFSFSLPDSNIVGSFSVSVTDGDRTYYPAENNIMTGLLLNQDTKDKVFADNSIDMDKAGQAELVLGSAAWMDQSKYAGMPSIVLDSNYLMVTGKVFDKDKNKPIVKGDMSFIFLSKDSTKSYVGATIGKDGSFTIRNQVFEGEQTVKYAMNDNKWKELLLKVDSSGLYEKRPAFLYEGVADRSAFTVYGSSEQVKTMLKEEITKMSADSISSTGLTNVTVTARKQTPTQKLNERYSRGSFSNLIIPRVIDMINDPPGNPIGNILDFLQGNYIPGLMVTSLGGNEYSITQNRALSMTSATGVRIYLNESEVTIDYLKSIQAHDVALIKYFPAGTSSISGTGTAGILVIYTKKPEDGGTASGLVPLGTFKYNGYTPVKDFTQDFVSAKEYLSANRNTIYWSPIIVSDNKGFYRFRFKNSDQAKKFHIIIEGLTIDGRMVHYEQVFQ
jgi:hypothetical protein